ncbi:MAG: RNA polymerase sigma-70 factor [Mangrovibacterium sp.]|nr:RNA polymerase sigma-70 factor [Mangrovibacterium sp.]
MKVLSNDMIGLLNKKNEAAFGVAFTVYYPRLVAFAREYVPEDDAQNLVQDAFVTLLEKMPVFSTENQLQSYLYTNVKNNCLMFLRHEKVKKKYSDHKIAKETLFGVNLEALERLDTSPVTFMEIEQIVHDTLEKLPPRCREIFILSRMEGRKNAEVAGMFQISVKAVEGQITKALKVLKVALKDYLALLVFLF